MVQPETGLAEIANIQLQGGNTAYLLILVRRGLQRLYHEQPYESFHT